MEWSGGGLSGGKFSAGLSGSGVDEVDGVGVEPFWWIIGLGPVASGLVGASDVPFCDPEQDGIET